jgi:hypothetical protein
MECKRTRRAENRECRMVSPASLHSLFSQMRLKMANKIQHGFVLRHTTFDARSHADITLRAVQTLMLCFMAPRSMTR